MPAPAPAPVDPAVPTPAPTARPRPRQGLRRTAPSRPPPATCAIPPDGVPHLSSPENLPPGTTDAPPDGDQPRTLGYLRDLWHAVQTQEVSGRDALLLLTQRPMNAERGAAAGNVARTRPPLPSRTAADPAAAARWRPSLRRRCRARAARPDALIQARSRWLA